MNILVTGGAGFIGSNLVQYLLGKAPKALGQEVTKVVNLDKLTYAGNLSNLQPIASDPRHVFVEGDIIDADLMTRLLAEHAITHVMHLAAESHVDRSIDSPFPFVETNVVGSFQLLDACRKHWEEQGKGEAIRFLHVSTDEVYGSLELNDPAFSESNSYLPNSPYSASKAASDHLARAYFHTYGLPVITTNCSNNYGPYQFPAQLIPLMIQKVIRGENLPVYGDGSNIRDWLYVEDHCSGLFRSLVKGQPGETYCIGGKREMRNIDLVRTLIEVIRELVEDVEIRPADEIITFVTDRPGHDKRYAIDCTKICSELGWEPDETFESGIRRTVQWYLDNPEWIAAIEDKSYQLERLGQKG